MEFRRHLEFLMPPNLLIDTGTQRNKVGSHQVLCAGHLQR